MPVGDDDEPGLQGAWTATVSLEGAEATGVEAGLQPADRIGRFAVLRVLGQGGMGRVLVGYDEQLDRRVAIKLLRWPDQHDRARARLMREAQALARLSHPHVVQVHETGTHGEAVFIAMELVEGQTLSEWCRAQARPWTARLDVLVQAGRGLEAAHRAGMVHRDFKPDNVVVGADGRARVLDFGLARGLEADASLNESPSRSNAGLLDAALTVQGSVMGTPAYMAPEQHDGQPCDASADQFAFCVTAFEALFGTRPFAAGPMAALALAKHEGSRAPIPSDSRVPRAVREAILRGLAPLPGDRWPEMGALLDVLERARRGRRRWLVPALGAMLVLGAVGANVLAPTSRSEPCAEVGAPVERIWSAERRAASLERLSSAEAEATVERFDRWAESWAGAALASCEDVYVRQLLSPASLDRRGACLGRRLATFDALTEGVARGEPAGGLLSSEWLGRLDDPADCLGEAVLRERAPAIPAQHEAEIAALRRDLVRVELERDRQTVLERIATAEQLLARSRELGWPPLVGEAALVLGRSYTAARDGAAARSSLGEAIDIGDDMLDLEQRATAWSAMNQVERLVEFDVERARWAWEREAAVLEGEEASPRQRAQLSFDRGQTEELAGRAEDAERSLREALALLDDIDPPPAWQQATVLRSLGNLLAYTSRADEAQALFDRARELELGPGAEAPPGGSARNEAAERLDEGIAMVGSGDHEAAVAFLHEGLAVAIHSHGVRSEMVARYHVVLAAIYDGLGRHDELRTHAGLADRISLEAVGPVHPMRTDVLSAVGVSALRDGRIPDAVRAMEGALRIIRRIKPDDSLEVAHTEHNLADVLHHDGQDDRARDLLAHALPVLERGLDEDDPLLEEARALQAKLLGAAPTP